MLNPGDTIGKYEVQNLLGQGGMGTVYLCRDKALARNVAIKVINPKLAGVGNALERFQNEARAIAQLASTHVVHVYEYNPEAEPPYLVMEFVRGRSVSELIKQEAPLSVDLVVDCARQVVQGLAEAHANGVVHRDIKPANILQSETGTYKLMDFGLARSLDTNRHVTTEGTMLGTVAYMAPEVARGESATAQSDLYSLGVTIYEMLSGKLPRSETSPLKLIHRIANDPLPSIRVHREDIPPAIVAWLDKLLAHDPDARYASAREAKANLDRIAGRISDASMVDTAGATVSTPMGAAAADSKTSHPDVRLSDVDSIIERAQRIEQQGRDILSDDSLLEIARELNIKTEAVRDALQEYRQRSQPAASPPPEAVAAPSPNAAAASPPQAGLTNEVRQATANTLDRVWWAYLVGVIGLYVPLADIYFCEIACLFLLGVALKPCRQRGEDCFWSAGVLATINGWLYVAIAALGIGSLLFAPINLLKLPIAIVAMIFGLVVYWRIMTGTADVLQRDGHWELGEWTLGKRTTYIIVSIVLFFVSLGIGIGIALALRNPRDQLAAQLCVPLIGVPLSWILGWFYILKPLGRARQALRTAGSTRAQPTSAPVASPVAPPPSAPAQAIRVDDVNTIIAHAMRLERQGRDLTSEESVLEIARDLNISTDAVRAAVLAHRKGVHETSAMPRPLHQPPRRRTSVLVPVLVVLGLLFVIGFVVLMGGLLAVRWSARSELQEAQDQARMEMMKAEAARRQQTSLWSAQAVVDHLRQQGIVNLQGSRSIITREGYKTIKDQQGNQIVYDTVNNKVIVITKDGDRYEHALPNMKPFKVTPAPPDLPTPKGEAEPRSGETSR